MVLEGGGLGERRAVVQKGWWAWERRVGVVGLAKAGWCGKGNGGGQLLLLCSQGPGAQTG